MTHPVVFTSYAECVCLLLDDALSKRVVTEVILFSVIIIMIKGQSIWLTQPSIPSRSVN